MPSADLTAHAAERRAGYNRLREVNRHYDSGNLFHLGQNIRP
ncbi:MAG: BBE domain-containing protein [Propionibacteriaceae bacterium]